MKPTESTSPKLIANAALRERIRGNLLAFDRRAIEDQDLRSAAVAVVVTGSEAGDSACFLLTRRARRLKRHSGQYALPGGRVDEGEDTVGAALRELGEELALMLGRDAVLGRLDDFPTRSGFRITPVVVWGGPRVRVTPSPAEVSAVFRIPLEELMQPCVPQLEEIPESDHPVLSAPLPTLGHEIYAPTAAILYQFRDVALKGKKTRVAHYEQPHFAWR